MNKRMKIKFQDLYESLIDFTKLAISKYLFAGIVNTDVLKIHEKGYAIGKQPVKRYFIECASEMQKTPEYNKCIELLTGIPKVKKNWDSVKLQREPVEWDLKSHIDSKYLEPFIVEIAEKTDCQFDPDTFNEIYVEFENFLKNDKLEFKTLEISPLPHFQSESEEIDLIDGLRIRKVTREEKENIWLDFSLSGFQRYSNFSVLPSCDFVVEYTWGRERPEANVRHVALALSLFKPRSRIDYHGSFNYRISWQKVFVGISNPEPMAHSVQYKLTKQEANKFLEFWKTEFLPIVKKKEHFMKIALSRFEDFRRRRNWIMGLVDLIICLEAMYLSKDQELSYRLSHRCATLLGYEKSGEEKEQIRNFIKIAYDVRSKLVHGGKINWERIKNRNKIELRHYDFVEQVFEYVRQSFRRFLTLTRKYGLTGKKHENFLHVVDSSIYNEKPLKEYLIDG